tara:strand:- start:394 stop:1077 length:684 start_codon:yes stop_codon:yes gene_type:complete
MEQSYNMTQQEDDRLRRLSHRENVSQLGQGYTRFVRIMRFALPLAAIVLVVVLVLGQKTQESIIEPIDEATTPELSKESIERNELLNPKFESMDKKNQPYKITADRAIQGKKNKDLIMLDRPIGTMTLDDGMSITVHSDTGAYRQDTERFFLQGGVFLEQNQGYTMQTDEAHIDLRQNYVWSEKQVTGQGPDITIDASGVRANGQTGEIVFTGPAKLVLTKGFEGGK